MLVIQINCINFKPFKRTFNRFSDCLRLTIKHLSAVYHFDAKLSRYYNFSFEWSKRFTYQFLVCLWAINPEFDSY